MQTVIIDKSKEWTVEEFLQLEESKLPCELINGEVFMSPAPNLIHQVASSNLNDVLKAYARKTGGFAAYSPFDVYLDNKNVFQPDLLYLMAENRARLFEKGLRGAPDLAVEIILPSNSHKDRNQKKKLYESFGVTEYWVIDPANRTLEIYDFGLSENPALYLVEAGEVTSKLMIGLRFRFEGLF